MSPAVPTGLSGAVVAKALGRGGLAPGTLRSVLRQADWTVEDLEEHLK
jgi:hypothetical protein